MSSWAITIECEIMCAWFLYSVVIILYFCISQHPTRVEVTTAAARTCVWSPPAARRTRVRVHNTSCWNPTIKRASRTAPPPSSAADNVVRLILWAFHSHHYTNFECSGDNLKVAKWFQMTGASPLCGSVMVRRTVGTDQMSRTIAVSTFFISR